VIHVDTAGALYPLRIDPFIQVAKFSDADATNFAELGAFALDVQGTTAVASKVTAGATMPSAVDVFVASSGRWELGATKVAELTDPMPDPIDEGFGTSVALSADGTTIAVGVPSATVPPVTGVGGEGKILVFEEPTNGWGGTITAPKTLNGSPAFGTIADNLGKSVSISADGSIIAGGVPGRASSTITSNVGGVFVFLRPGMRWMDQGSPKVLTHNLGRANDQMGSSVALSANGNTIVAGTPGFGDPDPAKNLSHLGEAWVFQQPHNGWAADDTPDAVLLAPNAQQFDFFGQSTAISDDAKTIVVGATGFASNRGAAFVFTRASGDWTMAGAPAPSATLTSSDQAVGVGRSVATDGRVVVAGPFTVAVGGNMGQGAAYVFVEPSGGWSSETETQKLVASDGASGDGLGGTVESPTAR